MAIICNMTDSHLIGTVAGAPTTGDEISITCWMSGIWSTGATVTLSFVGIYGPSVAAPTTAIQIGSRVANSAVCVWTYGGNPLITTPAGVVQDGVNYFIAYTFDGTSHRLYVDGVLQATTTTTQNAGQFNTFFINGFPPVGTALETSTHTIESVRMYERALSTAEIQTMHATRGARHNIISGLLAYYEFDEGASGAAAGICYDLAGRPTPGNLAWAGTGTTLTYTYPSGEGKHRPAAVN